MIVRLTAPDHLFRIGSVGLLVMLSLDLLRWLSEEMENRPQDVSSHTQKLWHELINSLHSYPTG